MIFYCTGIPHFRYPPTHPQEDTCVILPLDSFEYGRSRRAVWLSLQTLVSLLLDKAPAVG